MRLLVLTFYFPPDLSAGSFRASALVSALRERVPAGTQIDIVTTLPNRYRTFVQEAAETERAPGLEIRRIALPPHRSDMLGQARAFGRFARAARQHIAGRRYDLVFATSSRLMTAALGAWIARRQKARLYLDIRDIFTESIADVLPSGAGWLVSRVFSLLERVTMRRADRINLISRGFESYFRSRFPDRSYAWFTNGIDDEFIAAAPSEPVPPSGGPTTMLYAGNIGEGQALHHILPGLASRLLGRARFIVIGDGGRRTALEQALAAAGVTNVELRAPLARPMLLEAYRSADVLFLHLGPQPVFETVLPSKLFEYAALGKPVLAGVGGYAARFVREEIRNAGVFAPCDVVGAVRAFETLRPGTEPRPEFIAKFSRGQIARAMADDMLAVALGRG